MASPSSHAHQRKIELQSPLDLAHLEAQARKAARSRIDAALPPAERNAAGEDDVVRRRVEELVDAYIKRTYEGVRRNVCVNGMDFDEGQDGKDGRDLEEEFEPLDTRLADRIRTLESNKEILTEKVADLRRTAPSKAADQWREQWDANATTTSVAVKSETLPNGKDSAQDGGLTINQPPRWDDVQDMWERGALGLVQLKSGLTETSGKLGEAKKVVDHIDG